MIKKLKNILLTAWHQAAVFSYTKIAKPVSVFSRQVFEFRKIKQSFGAFVFASTLAGVFLPSTFSSFQTNLDTSFTKLKPELIELTTKHSLQKPVGYFRLTKQYSFFHKGLDFATDAGTAILPILPGRVEKISRIRFGYGNHVIINHGSGLKSLYAHLSKIPVQEGQEIDQETVLGFIGSTGWSTGPHLHLEITDNGEKINPKLLFENYFGEKLASRK